MQTHVTGVFEGGGIRGLALTGAAAGALDLGYRFEHLVGTSAGAIVSALVAAGYESGELRSAVITVDWPAILGRRGTLTKNLAMVLRLGFHSGGRLEGVLRKLLRAKGVKTFADLPAGALRVVATDLNHGRGIVLPDDLPRLGHDPGTFPVARAVLMSSAVPFVFQPVRLTDKAKGEELLLADGAMAARFPVQLVPRGPASVGFRLRLPPDRHPHHTIRGPVSLAMAVIGAGITAREDLPPVCGPLDTLVEVEVDQDSLDFDITPRRAEEIFEMGYQAATAQLRLPPGTQPLPPASIPA